MIRNLPSGIFFFLIFWLRYSSICIAIRDQSARVRFFEDSLFLHQSSTAYFFYWPEIFSNVVGTTAKYLMRCFLNIFKREHYIALLHISSLVIFFLSIFFLHFFVNFCQFLSGFFLSIFLSIFLSFFGQFLAKLLLLSQCQFRQFLFI